MLSEVFADAGYSTAAFTENGFVASKWGFAQGFDRYHNGSDLVRNSSFTGKSEHTFGRAIGWLAAKSSTPVFLFIQSYEVHIPYSPPLREIGRLSVLRRHRYKGMFSTTFNHAWMSAFNQGEMDFTPLERRQIELLYDAEVRSLDAQVGRLSRAIRELGIEDDTLLVLFSDHGEEFFEHGVLGHGATLYEQVLRVPLVLRDPSSLASGKRIAGVASLVDLAPTIVELAGLEPSLQTDSSESLADLIRESGSGARPRTVVSQRVRRDAPCAGPEPGMSSKACESLTVAVRDGEFSFIYDEDSGRAELYDVSRDRSERRNVAERFAGKVEYYKGVVANLPSLGGGNSSALKEEPIPAELERNLRALGYVE